MKACLSISVDLTVKDKHVETILHELHECLQQAGHRLLDVEIMVTGLAADAVPQPWRSSAGKHLPC